LVAEIGPGKQTEEFGDDVDGFTEETNEAEALGNKLAVNRDLKNRINEIDTALNKIRTGAYGVCEKCGGEISDNVLDVVPESQLCERCKSA